MTPLVFLDTETTGLDPHLHQIWDCAWITIDDQGRNEHQVFVQHDASEALKLPAEFRADWARRYDADEAVDADELVRLLNATIAKGAHLIGACPWFDQEFLRELFDNADTLSGAQFPWHYHLIDVEGLAVGFLRGQWDTANLTQQKTLPTFGTQPPWNSEDLSRAIGVDPASFDRHTALGDARWAEAIYEQVMTR